MKHLLNNLTEEEKNSIRGQHTGGMNVVTENFSKLINTKSGNVRTYLNEQSTTPDSIVTLLKSKGFTGKESPKEILIQYMIKQLNSMKNNNDTEINDVIDFIIKTGDSMESLKQTQMQMQMPTVTISSPRNFTP